MLIHGSCGLDQVWTIICPGLIQVLNSLTLIHKLFWYKSQWWWWWCYHMMMMLMMLMMMMMMVMMLSYDDDDDDDDDEPRWWISMMMMMMMMMRRRRRIGGRVIATTHTCWLATAGGTPHRAKSLWSVRMAMDSCMQSAICKHNGASIYLFLV